MAKPVEFPEQNCVFQKPPSMTDEECASLPAHIDNENHQIISCWELSEEELKQVFKTGRIYLSVLGDFQPPVAVMGQPPFVYGE